MSTQSRRPGWLLLPELAEWLEAGLFGRQPIHLEEYEEEGAYVVRADLPGLQSPDDVHVHVTGDRLSISAERREDVREKHRSELRYGQFTRTLTLPSGSDTDRISARYANGVLEIRVPVAEPVERQRIPVRVDDES